MAQPRSPVLTRPTPIPSRAGLEQPPQNVLLLAVGGTPARQTDWPNPPPRLVFRGYEFSFPLSLVGQDQFFGAAGQGPCYDWPNPKPPRVDIRGYTSSFPLSLIGQDQFFAAPGMGPFYDYPLPIRRTPPQNLHIVQQPLPLVVAPGTPIFVSATELPIRLPPLPLPAQIINILPLRSLGFTKILVPKVRTTDPSLRRHCDLVSDILNSLIRQGILRLEDLGEWTLDV